MENMYTYTFYFENGKPMVEFYTDHGWQEDLNCPGGNGWVGEFVDYTVVIETVDRHDKKTKLAVDVAGKTFYVFGNNGTFMETYLDDGSVKLSTGCRTKFDGVK